MKNFRWFMIVIVSMCFVMGVVSMGWSAEQLKQIEKQVIPIAPHCPAGFTMAPDGSRCDRTKPANPCASGFHVEWGTCITGTPGPVGLGAGDPYPCGYKCIPNAPAAGSYLIKCVGNTGPPIIAGPCQIKCTDVLY